MKKREIGISIVIIAVAVVLAFYFFTQQKGHIKIDTTGAEIQLRTGWFGKTTIASGSEPATLSARVYKPEQIQITRKQNGDTWQIQSFGPWGKLAKINVKNNETTVLKPGPPLLIKPTVGRYGSQVLIAFSMTGQANERYNTAVIKNGKRIAPPKLKIVDEAGNVLSSGKFEYG